MNEHGILTWVEIPPPVVDATLNISIDELHVDELRTIRRIFRNIEIRRRYRELLPTAGQLQAIYELADRYGLSDRHIRTIIYGKVA